MDRAELFAERAAIREYDGGLPRDESEALALGDVAIQHGWDAAVQLSITGETHAAS